MSRDAWTLEELGERVRDALATGYVAPGSARVRAVPDPRTIRYYTTLGLIDRPALRGRTALYGERHLLQLVAIKRLQAEGLSLTQVQERLSGLPTERLRGLARLEDTPTGASGVPAARAAGDVSSPTTPTTNADAPAVSPSTSSARRDFWRSLPPAPVETPTVTDAEDAASEQVPAGALAPEGDEAQDLPGVSTLLALELGPGVTLTLGAPGDERRLNPEDVEALRRAAGPLLRALTERGLLPGEPAADHEEEIA